MNTAAVEFARESARYLHEVYPQRLARALEILPPGDLWWRPHGDAISLGTILRHLEGNVRQWILSGLGGEPDQRDRASEFAAEGAAAGPVLLAALAGTTAAAARRIETLSEEALLATYRIQGFRTSGLAAVYHVVEHFSWHTGEAVWIAKARAGEGHGLAFFGDSAVNAARNRGE